jgi:hypothetical protein
MQNLVVVSSYEALVKAKSLIDTPEKWIQGDAKVKYADGSCRYCSVGAIYEINSKGMVYLRSALININGGDSVATYNDNHTHEEVMALWDKAIELAKSL